VFFKDKVIWRKRVRVERTGDGQTRRPPVLKTGRVTGPHALPFCQQGLYGSMLAGVLIRCIGLMVRIVKVFHVEHFVLANMYV